MRLASGIGFSSRRKNGNGMLAGSHIVVFRIAGQRFGLPLSVVDRVLPALAVTQLARAPDVILGLVNIQGELIPVINLRKRFRLSERSISPSDQLLLARTAERKLGLWVDEVLHVELLRADAWIGAESLVPGSRYLSGAIANQDGMTLIHDLDTCLSLKEQASLDAALADASEGA